MSPEQKAAWLEENQGKQSLFIGDGANDSLAFEQAACRGTPVVSRGILEAKADFLFLGRSLQPIRALFDIANRRRRTLRIGFLFAVLYNAAALSLCLAAIMNPLLAAILMPLSSLATLSLVAWSFRKQPS